jgi:hypothetical protein
MVVVYFNTESFIPILPRETITDTGLLTMFLTGESDNIRVEFPVVVESYVNGILTLNATQIAVVTKVSQTFKLEIKLGEDFVYLGRLINVDPNTDIQNYSPASQTTSIFS